MCRPIVAEMCEKLLFCGLKILIFKIKFKMLLINFRQSIRKIIQDEMIVKIPMMNEYLVYRFPKISHLLLDICS